MNAQSNQVTLVEILELTQPLPEFSAVAERAVRRLELEGIRSLKSVNFYSDPDSRYVGGVLVFDDPGEMLTHINMIREWEEFHALVRTVKPVEVRVHGKLIPEVEEWLRGMNLEIQKFPSHAAGFSR